MKINIAAPGRFHVCDLARELNNYGHDVRFYSYVPTKRALRFGLPKQCSRSLLGLMLPFLFLEKLFPSNDFVREIKWIFQDYFTAFYMRKCDVFIAMSGNYVYSLKSARKNGALIVLERGSKHILDQKAILEEIPSLKGFNPVPNFNVRRELKGYELADYICFASNHVEKTFIKRNFPTHKLFRNPYGVDLSDFYKLDNTVKKFDAIMVGGWSLRKGCDLITKVFSEMNLSFLHVGGLIDLDFPEHENFTHYDAVDEKDLVKFYNQAKIFVLPSREEGMAMVQMQAIACNLPIVCSEHTGGLDIGELTGLKSWIFQMDDYTVSELSKNIKKALKFYETTDKIINRSDLIDLEWRSYGSRYSEFLQSI